MKYSPLESIIKIDKLSSDILYSVKGSVEPTFHVASLIIYKRSHSVYQ